MVHLLMIITSVRSCVNEVIFITLHKLTMRHHDPVMVKQKMSFISALKDTLTRLISRSAKLMWQEYLKQLYTA